MNMEPTRSAESHGVVYADFFAEASDWHTRLDEDPASAEVRAQFDAWLAADSRHRNAYRQLDDMWTCLSAGQADPGVLSLRRDALNATGRRRRWLNKVPVGRQPIRMLAAAAAILVACGGLLVGFRQFHSHAFKDSSLLAKNDRIEGGTFHTAIGERSTVTMSDGSVIVLNTNTRVDINFSPSERHVGLVGGQAWFQVAKNPNRPFIVDAGGERVTALGTAFDVRLADKDVVQVTLLEGRVRVVPLQSTLAAMILPAPTISELAAGETLIATGNEPTAKRKIDVSRVSSWRQGRIFFDDDSLDVAAAEVNRYSQTKIVLADPVLRSLRVSGVFTVGHSESFVETVVAHFPIRIAERTDDRIVLTSSFP